MKDIENAKPKLTEHSVQTEPDPEAVRNRMKILSLESRVKTKTSELLSTTELMSSLQEENMKLKGLIKEVSNESKKIKTEAQLVEDTHKFLTLKLEAANNEIDRASLDCNQLRLSAEKSYYDLVDSQKEVERLKGIIIELRERNEKLTEGRSLSREGNKRLRSSLDKKIEENNTLQQQYNDLVRVLEESGISKEILFAENKKMKEFQQQQEREQPNVVGNVKKDDNYNDFEQDPAEDDVENGLHSPVGVQGVRTIKEKKNTSSTRRRDQQLVGRPTSAPGGVIQERKRKESPIRRRSPTRTGSPERTRSGHHHKKKKHQERCQECNIVITGKGRILPSTIKSSIPQPSRDNAAYVHSLSPDALIQNYLTSG